MRALRIAPPLFVALTLVACASGTGATKRTTRAAGARSRNLVLIDATTAKVNSSFPDANGSGAGSVVGDGHGGWYIAGGFTRIGDVKRPGLAHLNRDGTVDPSFAPDVPAAPVAFGGKAVYATTGSSIIALDARTGRRLWVTHGVGTVLAVGNGVLYVGQVFSKIGGVRREAVAALDPSTGKPTGWAIRGWGSVPPEVDSIVAANGVVYLGGVFTRIGGVPDSCDVAAVSAKTGRTLWVPKGGKRKPSALNCTNDVESIVVSHGQVLAGSYHGGFASFDIRTGRVLPWSNGVDGAALPFAVSGNTVYLGGRPDTLPGGFHGVDGKAVNNLAAVTLPSGRLKNWHPKLGRCVYVSDIAVSGRKVLVAGSFNSRSCTSLGILTP